MWNVVRTSKFRRDYKNLSHEARTRCDAVISQLAASSDPRAMAYERLRGPGDVYVYRFGDYRLLYGVYDKVEVLEVQRVGYGHSVY